jgi:septum formation protein
MNGDASPDPVLPLMRGLRYAPLPTAESLILASGSPRRAELLAAAGYPFRIELPEDHAEDLPRPGEPAEAVVQRLAFQKAENVAARLGQGWIVAADTLGVCEGVLLGKPVDEADARRMLRLLRGQVHHVLTGICLWDFVGSRRIIEAVRTDLRMSEIADATIEDYIRSGRWRGKAGGFGYQDGNDWLHVLDGGSESNVVGLPMERLAHWLERPDQWPRIG